MLEHTYISGIDAAQGPRQRPAYCFVYRGKHRAGALHREGRRLHHGTRNSHFTLVRAVAVRIPFRGVAVGPRRFGLTGSVRVIFSSWGPFPVPFLPANSVFRPAKSGADARFPLWKPTI